MTRSQLLDYLINSGDIHWSGGVIDCPVDSNPDDCSNIDCGDCWMEFLTKGYKSHKVDSQ